MAGEDDAGGGGGQPQPPVQVVEQFQDARLQMFPPPKLSQDSINAVEDWQMFKQQFEIFQKLTNLDKQPKTFQSAAFLHCVGPRGIKIYNGLTWAPAGENNDPPAEDKDDISLIIRKFDKHILGEVNETYERYKFFKRDQNITEPIDDYVSSLKELAKTCNFCDCMKDSLLRDKIVLGIRDNSTRKILLQKRQLSLTNVIDICRGAEATQHQLKSLGCDKQPESVNKVFPQKKKKDDRRSSESKGTKSSSMEEAGSAATDSDHRKKPMIDCKFCGQWHVRDRRKCPAWGKTCTNCNGRNHSESRCYKKKVHNVLSDYESDDSSDFENVYAVGHNNPRDKKEVYAKMLLNNEMVRFQIDCGATVNLLPKKYIRGKALRPTTKKLQMWNKSELEPEGSCFVPLRNPKNGKKYRVKFTVIQEDLTPLLGKKVSEKMGLIKINYDSFHVASVKQSNDILDQYPEVFKDNAIGVFPCKPVHLVCRDDAVPKILPTRREPVAFRGRLQSTLDNMCKLGVLVKVDEPTDWVNQMAIQEKKSGELRVCLDPRPLNEVLKKEQYTLPTLEEILPYLSDAKVFTKLDLAHAFWHVRLDEESSLLTTFASPHGRYRWTRLPFGLSVSSEIFQKHLHQALGGLDGVICVADDIVVYGCGEDYPAAVKNHDEKLSALLERCETLGVKLNKQKCEIRKDKITFLGHEITQDGLRADPEKIQGIVQMKRPQNKTEVQVLQGTVNYLARFMPKLAEIMAPIRQLTCDGVDFVWGKSQDQAFKHIKTLVTKAPVLAYYKPDEELVLQCDASNKGLGAVLLQKGRPIAYKSRALTETESRYASIEKEMLAVVWSLEKFHQYTYGRKILVHSDHKPLEAITRKSLASAPKRLQNMLIRAQNYDYTIVWQKGKDQVIADLLSRISPAISLGDADFEHINMCAYLPMGDERLEQLRKATEQDDVLAAVKTFILNGWPEDKSSLPSMVIPYFSFSDELTVQNGILFKRDRVVVPYIMRKEMRKVIHEAHLGVTGCTKLARESLFWPGMTSEIREYISTCEICRRYERSNQKETLMSPTPPDRPWQKVGMDIFELEGVEYLVTVDYFSNYWELDRLEDTTSTTIIRKLKANFARHGIPTTLVSDNAANLTSEKMRQFTYKWDICHVTSSPHNPRSNGMAESAVKTAKTILRKCKEAGGDEFLAVLNHRNTPSQDMDESPVQRLFNRRTRTLLPTTANLLEPKTNGSFMRKKLLKKKAEKQAEYYNKGAKDLPVLEEGDTVRMKPHVLGEKVWKKGTVNKRLDERSYEILAENGNTYRRNRVHLKRTKETGVLSEPEVLNDNQENVSKDQSVELVSRPEQESSVTTELLERKHEQKQRNLNISLGSSSSGIKTQVQPGQTRSGRTTRPPIYLKDFQC
jgi:transposase InsO family protein